MLLAFIIFRQIYEGKCNVFGKVHVFRRYVIVFEYLLFSYKLFNKITSVAVFVYLGPSIQMKITLFIMTRNIMKFIFIMRLITHNNISLSSDDK